MEIRQVAMDERAVTRAEKLIIAIREKKGIRNTIGGIFAQALDNMIESMGEEYSNV